MIQQSLADVRLLDDPDARWGQVRLARSFGGRLIGLMGRKALAPLGGLWLEPGGSIHTIGMLFPIDCLFLDAEYRVLRNCTGVRPFRLRWAPRATRAVLELPAGSANGVAIGTRLIRESYE